MTTTLISILSGLGGMFGWGTSDFFANNAAEKIGHSKTVFYSQIFGALILLFLLIFFPSNSNLEINVLPLLIFGSLCYAFGYVYLYKAFEIGNLSITSTVSNLNVVIGMAIAFLFRDQRLSGNQLFAVSLILLGIFLVSININDLIHSKVSLLSGVKEALVAAFAFGFFWNISEILSEDLGWLATSLLTKIISLFALYLIFKLTKQSLDIKKQKNILPIVAIVGILEALAVASVNFGLEVGDLVLVDPIAAALSVVTVSLAVIFLKEKLTTIQTLGIFSTIVGIVLTAI